MADVVWDGVTRRATLKPEAEAAKLRDELADAAHAYLWDRVPDILAANPDLVNVTRLNGASRYTPLHQAAHAGAPGDVVDRLVRLDE